MFLVRCLFAGYWVLLTTLLLVPDPLGWLGLRRMPGGSGGGVVHFATFALLAVLLGASRFRMARAWLVLLPIGYALMTEWLQGYVGRDTSGWDALADLLGLAVGATLWGASVWYARRFGPRRRRED